MSIQSGMKCETEQEQARPTILMGVVQDGVNVEVESTEEGGPFLAGEVELEELLVKEVHCGILILILIVIVEHGLCGFMLHLPSRRVHGNEGRRGYPADVA